MAVLLALIPALAFGATQGPPAYVYTGAAPSGACVGTRVWIDALGTGTYYCNAGTWASVSGGGHAITDEGGAALTSRPTLNFTGAAVTATDNAGASRTDVTIPWPTLNQVGAPTGDRTFTFPSGNKLLLEFSGATDYAFSIHGTGAFTGSGDLVHLHLQGTPGVAAGADVLHLEAEDADATGLRISMASSAHQAATITGAVDVTGDVAATSFTGPLTGNADTASAPDITPGLCPVGQAARGINTGWSATGCFAPTAAPTSDVEVLHSAAATAGVPLANSGTLTFDAAGWSTADTTSYDTQFTLKFVPTTRNTSTGDITAGKYSFSGPGGAAEAFSIPTAGASGTTYLRGDGTWSTPSAGAGGSTTQVQYSNGGALGGMARVTTDGNDLVVTRQSTHPAAPSAGFLKAVGFGHHGTSSPTLLQMTDGSTELEWHNFPHTLAQDDHWGCVSPAGAGNTTLSSAGVAPYTGNTTGTAAAVNWASTDERTRHPFVQFAVASAANVSVGVRANADVMSRGNATGLGGWYWWATVNIVSAGATQRTFFGLKDATAVITATTDPSASLDTVYFGSNSAGSTLNICSNDNAGAATCVDLGANFPTKTANTAYDLALWTAPNSGTIYYYVRRLVNGSEAQGTITSDLPRNTVALGWDLWLNSGSTAAIPSLQLGGTCYVANP